MLVIVEQGLRLKLFFLYYCSFSAKIVLHESVDATIAPRSLAGRGLGGLRFADEPTPASTITYLLFVHDKFFLIGCMNVPSHSWRDLYRAALLEVNREQLPKVVEEARAAIQRKLHESTDGKISADELQALQDALQNLRVLQREYS